MISPNEISFDAIKQGNAVAFEQLFKGLYKQLTAYAFQFLKNQEDAEELVQETFYQVWEKRQTIEIKGSLQAYLFASVRNKSLNELAHLKVVKAHEEQSVNEDFDDSNALEQEELKTLIAAAVDRLPTERKKIFCMSKYEGLKYKEISDELGISIKTVENQMGKALKFLRIELAHLVFWLLLFIFQPSIGVFF